MVDDSTLHSLPLSSIPHRTRRLLSCLLNSPKVILSDGPDRLPRDWRGLAFLVNITSEVESYIQQYADKTAKVLDIWQRNNANATVGDLLRNLELIDRHDVYDDVYDDLRDAINAEISGSRNNQLAIRTNSNSGLSTETDRDQITYDDRPGYAHIYDAIVLYADEDKGFVAEMLRRMAEAGYQICTVDDLQVGHSTQYAPVTQLIKERCRRIILVFSPEFFNSTGMSFYTDYAQADSIETEQRKIIPIMYRPCQPPSRLSYLAHYHKLFYHSHGRPMYDFWHKLKQSLEVARMFNGMQRQRQIRAAASPPQVNIDELPQENALSSSEDSLFLPRSDHSASMNALDTLNISSIDDNEDSRSLGTVSQISGTSETKKKKKGVLFKVSLPSSLFSRKKSKKAIAI